MNREEVNKQAERCVRMAGRFIEDNAADIVGECGYPYVADDGFTITIKHILQWDKCTEVEVGKTLMVIAPMDDRVRYDKNSSEVDAR